MLLPPVPLLPGGRPSFYISQPQLEEPWFFRAVSPAPGDVGDHSRASSPCSCTSGTISSAGRSTISSRGHVYRSLACSLPRPAGKLGPSLSPAPSFTYLDDKHAAAASAGSGVTCCASQSVLKITLTFCFSFLLGMALTVVYMEVYLWRQRT